MPKRLGLSYQTSRAVGLRANQIFPYVVGPSYTNKSNPYRAKFRIHKGLPGHSGRDICLGNHEDEAVAALAVELFVPHTLWNIRNILRLWPHYLRHASQAVSVI